MTDTLKIDVDGLRSLIAELAKDVVREEAGKLLSDPHEKKKQFLTRQETAELLNVSLVTLNTWAKNNLLTPHKIGGRVHYKIIDINRLIEEQKRGK